MKRVVCDGSFLGAMLRLTEGPLEGEEDLQLAEQYIRAFVLHDEAVFTMGPYGRPVLKDESLSDWEICIDYGDHYYLTGEKPPDIQLAPRLIEVAQKYSEGRDDLFASHVGYLKRAINVIRTGGSALLTTDLGKHALNEAEQYPHDLFKELDARWNDYASVLHGQELGLRVPPVLAVVLTRCARRTAISSVILDLRAEWTTARQKVWRLLDAHRSAKTLKDLFELRRELSEASKLFSPEPSELDSRPVRTFYELVAAAGVGASAAFLSGKNAGLGALAVAGTQAARSIPSLIHDLGPALFGLGAFDLARRVRRSVSKVELDALPRILTNSEKQRLGFH